MSAIEYVVKTTSVAVVANVSRMALSLLTLPALIDHLGADGLGVWLVVLSLQGLFGFLGAGFTASTTTAVSRAKAAPTDDSYYMVASTAFYIALVASILIFLVGALPVALIDWHEAFSVTRDIRASDMDALMWVMLTTFALNFIGAFPKAVLIGRMEGYIFHALSLTATVMSAIAILVAAALRLPIHLIAVCYLMPQLLIPFLGGLGWLHRSTPGLCRLRYADRSTARSLSSEGGKLAINQAAFSVASSSDLMLIGLLLGAAAGTPYGVAQRLFAIPFLVLGTLTDAMWPLFARADSRGDHTWVRRAFLHLMAALVALTALTAGLIAHFYHQIVTLWLGEAVPSDPLLVAGAAAICVLQVGIHITTIVLRSMNQSGFLAKTMICMAIVNVPCSVALILWLGVAGAVWGSVISYCTCLALPHWTKIWKRTGASESKV